MNQSWRRKPTSDGSKQSGRYWQQQKKRDASADAENLRRVKLGILSVLLFGSIGIFVWRFLSMPTDLVVLPIAVHYQSPLPVNGLVAEDLDHMRATLVENFHVEEPILASRDNVQDATSFLRQLGERLDQLKPIGPSVWQKTLVVYMSAHGVVNEHDEPCFLMARSTPHDSSTWLPAKAVIQKLQEHPNLRRTDILLMLDSNRIDDCWELGIVENDFANRLANVVSTEGNERFYVINSASHGQSACLAPELGGTVFGHYVTLGLAGAIGDSSVSLNKLLGYLKLNVSEFTRQFRHKKQMPCLLKSDKASDDFLVAHCLDSPTLPVPDLADLRSELTKRSQTVASLWEAYEQCSTARAYRFQPMQFASVGASLARLENLIVAGSDYDDQYANTIRVTATEIEKLRRARDAFTDVATTAAVMSQFVDFRGLQAKPAFAAWRTATPEDAVPPADKRKAVSLVVWDWLSQLEEVHAAELDSADKYVDLAENDCTYLPSEVHFARLLSKYLPWDQRKDWKRILPRAFSIHRKTRELAAPDDIRSFYWVQDELDRIEMPLRIARDKLFVGSDQAIEAAVGIWGTIDPVDDHSGTTRLSEIRGDITAVSVAYQQRDASLALTPLFARWLASRPDASTNVDTSTIENLVTATNRLGSELDNRSIDGSTPYVNEISTALATLQEAFERECKKCADSGDERVNQETLRDAKRLLRFPIPTPGKTYHNTLRRKLLAHRWTTERELSLDVATGREFKGPTGTTLRSVADHPAAKLFANEFKKLDQEPSTLCELGGVIRNFMKGLSPSAEKLARKTQNLVSNPDGQRTKPAAARRTLSQADQLCRRAATFAPPVGLDFVNELWSYDHHFFLVWHANRSLLDLWGPEPSETRDTQADSHFLKSVASCLSAAKGLYPSATPYRDELAQAMDSANAKLTAWEPLDCDDLRLFDDVQNAGLVPHSIQYRPLVEPTDPLNTQLELENSTPAVYVRSWTNAFPWFDRESRLSKVPLGRREPTERLVHGFDGAALKKEPNLWAIALFRGHEKTTPLRADKGSGAVFHRPHPTETTVTVLGHQGPKVQIVFVLDCSGSMGTTKIAGTSMMSKAKTMLTQVTDLMRQGGSNYEVGLVVFAHRFSGEPKPDSKDPIRARIDTLVPIGPGDVTIPEIQRNLKRVKAEGFTPLYTSIRFAAGKFAAGGKKQMIVITDGENGVYGQNDAQATRIARDAQAAIENANIDVDIVGVGIANGTFQKGPLIRDFANGSNRITFQNNSTIRKVKQMILETLGITTYSVTHNGGKTESMSLGQRWKSPVLSPGNSIVAVANGASEEVLLEGGEALEIEAGRRLVHRPYRTQDDGNDIETNSQRVRFHTNVHTGAEFSISIQNVNASFTSRPKRAMLVIRPENGKDEFIAHETEFELKRTVPVLHYRLTGWPRTSRALLEFSYSNDEPIGVLRVPLDLTNRKLRQPFISDVQLKLDTSPSRDGGPIQIRLTEIHDPDSKHYPLHLSLSPEPLMARHAIAKTTQSGNREILHEFMIEPERVNNVAVDLQVTTPGQRKIKWNNLAPISVDIDHWSR